jgi:hypothetical protein
MIINKGIGEWLNAFYQKLDNINRELIAIRLLLSEEPEEENENNNNEENFNTPK